MANAFRMSKVAETPQIDTSHPIEEEWKRIERTCTEVLQNEIRCYSGREQQKKGTITRNAQRTLFGEELPRGHGYKGKLSTKLSSLYDELMGRNPRKRQGRSTESSPLSTSKRLLLCSHRSPVGVIGNGPFACLLVERLLSKHHHVVLTHKETFSYVQSDASFTSQLALLPVTALQYQPSLPSFLSQCEVIFVSIASESAAFSFYTNDHNIFSSASSQHTIIDCSIGDLTFSNKVHSIASSYSIPYYDCSIFPLPTTLQSFDKNPVSIFLGGEFSPSETVGSILYSLGSVLFGGHKNQGIIYKMIVSQYLVIQEQALKEVYSTARNLGVTDSKLLGRLLSMCANPTTIIERNLSFPTMDEESQQSTKIPIGDLIEPIKHTFALPSSYAPVTSVACRIGEDVIQSNRSDQIDVSQVWRPIM
ncbi:3-hydroxyisobutyrate dehydrogenase [Blastocystis sp. subtype 4]|uniref:3-hydroxyisobutyrate dehydrogenase n=1 Tax=Blastocystis sp. subtype 4 TaxID=944170 RepID=UPI0007121C59|nr:3-hydroxyisobutyrate dehydrogenase [Blastocystis sp. subtype 4]KNB43549.1 3-hydroxyisobutyrate dehydrogenase [Blastocystis sp. subtype 4]|eukprot:XP_014526992.1 3-hydroxyisobutyrate dehydrogenase [Blastocystis sp. subtype 4]